MDGNSVTLLNVYAPHPQEVILINIWGGDLNVHLHPQLSSSGTTHDTKSLHRRVNTLFEDVGLVNILRDLILNRRDLT